MILHYIFIPVRAAGDIPTILPPTQLSTPSVMQPDLSFDS